MKILSTADLARAVGVHPNTVRRYAQWGLLPPVERAPNGYRCFTLRHLDCLRVSRLIYASVYASRIIRQSACRVIPHAVADDWLGALEQGRAHQLLVQSERAQAEAAAALLEGWAAGDAPVAGGPSFSIGQAARLLDVSVDVLRNWERNGFIAVPRAAHNHYRAYRPADISRLRVIRVLMRAGYSQMAILRMLLQLDQGVTTDLRHLLDTPPADEPVSTAADRWLSTLAEQEQVARRLVDLIESIHARRGGLSP